MKSFLQLENVLLERLQTFAARTSMRGRPPGQALTLTQRLRSGDCQASCVHSTSSAPAKDFFSLFGLSSSFDVDSKLLDSAYRDLQRQLHPDRHATASKADQEAAAENSAQVNIAYATLKSPLQRAKYVLQQHGHGTAQDTGGTIDDPELLMQVMEARELVEETQDDTQLHQLQHDNQSQQRTCLEGLSKAFQQKDWSKATELTTQLRYITRIGEAIHKKT